MSRARRVKVKLPEGSAIGGKAADLFARHLRERCGAEVTRLDPGDLVLKLEIAPDIGPEGFRIADGPEGEIRITGSDERGLLYGVGKLLRTSIYQPDGFVPGRWRGTSVPEKPVRGIYFATHFHNFYHEAPIADVERYIEDLGLWGFNALIVWFDMHHFTSINDPAAQAMIRRLRSFLDAAKAVGMSRGLVFLANEAYANSPEHLRADWTAGHDGYHTEPGGHYHVELCPSKPGARDLLLRWVEEKLEAFSDADLDYLWIWPYDQGGCTCGRCSPWGANGFLAMAEPIARSFRRRFPSGKVVLSTWYFDHFTGGEWEGLDKAFAEPPDWADYVLADEFGDHFPEYPLTHGVPGGLPMVGFPEISMYYGPTYAQHCPWGGFGANPFPIHLQSLWDQAGASLAGGFPYSEGIFEDINKAICAQFYWQPDKPALETVREYAAFEYSPKVAETVTSAVEMMERSLPRSRQDHDGIPRFVIKDAAGMDETWRLIEQADAQLTPYARASWRWRILYLRALIDFELAHNDFSLSDRCEEALRELTEIYHAHQAGCVVSPPTREAIGAMRPD
jgi:hypothetical protein